MLRSTPLQQPVVDMLMAVSTPSVAHRPAGGALPTLLAATGERGEHGGQGGKDDGDHGAESARVS